MGLGFIWRFGNICEGRRKFLSWHGSCLKSYCIFLSSLMSVRCFDERGLKLVLAIAGLAAGRVVAERGRKSLYIVDNMKSVACSVVDEINVLLYVRCRRACVMLWRSHPTNRSGLTAASNSS
jgi:hypothetical protein